MKAIPYMGSKKKLASEIVNFIRQRHNGKINFYDVFGGGGAISFKALSFFENVYYNEIDTSIVNLIKQLKIGFPDEWYEPVTRERFFKEIEKDTAYSGIVKTCWSFGNNKKSYMYGEDIEEDKLLLHELCVKNTPELIERAKNQIGIEIPDKLKGRTVQDRRLFLKRIVKSQIGRFDIQLLERLSYLESLTHLQSLTRLQSLQNLQSLQTTNKDYRDLKFEPNSVIYCDPPYKGTAGYGVDFNHDDFYKWALNQDYPVYISEYDAPKDLTLVKQIAHRSTLSGTNNAKKTIENLYWNGKGNPNKTTLF